MCMVALHGERNQEYDFKMQNLHRRETISEKGTFISFIFASVPFPESGVDLCEKGEKLLSSNRVLFKVHRAG